MAAAGKGVPPVEGRWSAAQWSGDPSQAVNPNSGVLGPGVWSGDPTVATYVAVQNIGKVVSKRQVSAQAIRQA